MNSRLKAKLSDISFLQDNFDLLVDERKYLLPSEWNEENRYLPKELTPKPGFYSYDYTPYLKEIIDQMYPGSPARKVVFMKPAQIGATTGILEAAIAYNIGAVPTSMLYISADKELVTIGMSTKVERMLDSCGLREKIASQAMDRKTGNTKTEKEFPGGFLHAIGARNPGKLRQMSYQTILFDELDGMPNKLGSEGDPVSLAENRSNAYASKRKLLYLSTPLILQTSKIYKLYLQGDQRNYYIPCKNCKEYQVLYWHGKNKQGDKYGVVFELDKKGKLIISSVGYKCPFCGFVMRNHDKAWFLPEGAWKATAESQEEGLFTYWMNDLYSPPGMYPWKAIVYDWLKCWDMKRDRVKDIEEYKTFRNTKQGLPFEERGEAPKYERVVMHRRAIYTRNEIPNNFILKETGSTALLLTCAVDCQKNNLFVDVKAWCEGGRSYTIDFREISGPTEDKNSPSWEALRKIIESERWHSKDDKSYFIAMTLIDAGHFTDYVYNFCAEYSSGVYPIFGRDFLREGVTYKELSKKTIEKAGCLGYHVHATKMKDRVSRSFSRDWNQGEIQPDWYPNFPEDFRDDYFRMFEAEHKIEERDRITNKFMRTRWVQEQGKDNHAFDTAAYSFACLDILASRTCIESLGLQSLEWPAFWDEMKKGTYYLEK